MKPEDLIAALGRGMMEAALAYAPPSTPAKRNIRNKRNKTQTATPPMEARQLPGQMEMPFDGEVAPPTITAEQLAEMEAVLQGKRGPMPGTYDPDGEYRTESPPWMA